MKYDFIGILYMVDRCIIILNIIKNKKIHCDVVVDDINKFINKVAIHQPKNDQYIYGFSSGDQYIVTYIESVSIQKLDQRDVRYLVGLHYNIFPTQKKKEIYKRWMKRLNVDDKTAEEFYDYMVHIDNRDSDILRQKFNMIGGYWGWEKSKALCWFDVVSEFIGLIPIVGVVGDAASIFPTMLRGKWLNVILDIFDFIPGVDFIIGPINTAMTIYQCTRLGKTPNVPQSSKRQKRRYL